MTTAPHPVIALRGVRHNNLKGFALDLPLGRLVVVTGRATCDLLPLLRLDPCPEIWGSHGWEPPAASATDTAVAAPAVGVALSGLATLAADLEARGVRVERKPSGLAVHWRGVAGERPLAQQRRER